MKIDLSHVVFTVLIPSVSSIWLIVPTTGFRCSEDLFISNQKLADFVQSGCQDRLHVKQNLFSRIMPLRRPLASKPYKGSKFAAMNPLFEIGVRETWGQGLFLKQPCRAVFEWDKKKEVCIPHGIVYRESGKEEVCQEIRIPTDDQFYSDSQSFRRSSLSHGVGYSPPGTPPGSEILNSDSRSSSDSPNMTPVEHFNRAESFNRFPGFFRQNSISRFNRRSIIAGTGVAQTKFD